MVEKKEAMSGDVVDTGMEVASDKALAAITAAEVDIQISTAHRFPRSLEVSRRRVTDLSCANAEVAASCFYSLPREGKTITGPSIRFAEIVASSWGNLRVQARITEIGDTMVVAQGVCHDLEANVAMSAEVRVRITKKNGQRYNDDMIGVACAAAMSKATRNAIFKVVPMATFADIAAKTRQVAGGDAKSVEQNRAAMLTFLKSEYKIDAKKLCRVLGVAGVADITTEMIADVRGRITAIKEGDASVETAFPEPEQAHSDDGQSHKFGFAGYTPATPPANMAPDGEILDAPAPAASQEGTGQPGDTAEAETQPEGESPAQGPAQPVQDELAPYVDLITAVNESVPGSTVEKVQKAVKTMLAAGIKVTEESLRAQVRTAKK
jgi:hypothetical protein